MRTFIVAVSMLACCLALPAGEKKTTRQVSYEIPSGSVSVSQYAGENQFVQPAQVRYVQEAQARFAQPIQTQYVQPATYVQAPFQYAQPLKVEAAKFQAPTVRYFEPLKMKKVQPAVVRTVVPAVQQPVFHHVVSKPVAPVAPIVRASPIAKVAPVVHHHVAPIHDSVVVPSYTPHHVISKPIGEQNVAILRMNQDSNYDGNFNFDFQAENGIESVATGHLKAVEGSEEPAQVMQGSYSYTAPDGTPVVTSWYADETGFHAEGDHLPVAPPMPEAIARSLEYIRSLPPNPEDQKY